MLFQVFLVSLVISALGTIPPATINITVMQLSLKQRAMSAAMLSLGAGIVDTFYAGLAISIHIFLSEKVEFTNYFYLIAAIVLIALGIGSIFAKKVEIDEEVKDQGNVGFIKGLILGILNPLAMPFWLGVTTYLSVNGWINLEGPNFIGYILGVFIGEVGFLMIIIRIGIRFKRLATNHRIVNVIPGWGLILLGLFNFYTWLAYYL